MKALQRTLEEVQNMGNGIIARRELEVIAVVKVSTSCLLGSGYELNMSCSQCLSYYFNLNPRTTVYGFKTNLPVVFLL